MSKCYTGTVTLDDIDMPLCDGKLQLLGDVTIRVVVEVDSGYTRDANGDGCPPCEMERDYEVVSCDFSVYCGDLRVCTVRSWDRLGAGVRVMLRDKYLDAACEACECGEVCE